MIIGRLLLLFVIVLVDSSPSVESFSLKGCIDETNAPSIRGSTDFSDPEQYYSIMIASNGQGLHDECVLTMDTCSHHTHYDTFLYLYDNTGAEVASNDGGILDCPLDQTLSVVSIPIESAANTLYYVKVSGYNGDYGKYNLRTTWDTDACAVALCDEHEATTLNHVDIVETMDVCHCPKQLDIGCYTTQVSVQEWADWKNERNVGKYKDYTEGKCIANEENMMNSDVIHEDVTISLGVSMETLIAVLFMSITVNIIIVLYCHYRNKKDQDVALNYNV